MTDATTDKGALREEVKRMALEGRTITYISKKLGISWGEARSYLPSSSWQGAKSKLTRRLKRLATESDQATREKMADEADRYADFLFDAAKHLRDQVDGARRALSR
jgi:hypothetical protein